ncbi:class I SAM-dependent methyltransferase [Flavobacterium album]|uniref:Class I SAM-dependent methyltransferase n=1 Tax=Flavobacterium album TaxID=2175091 RepID=A0A2S1R1A3_9FLAO|nr:class I SAM-dependent methyltransferase [Flavobacterium album]AWH86483.1 class I SAM-dependent methyltransferase [Flavobacterium album]
MENKRPQLSETELQELAAQLRCPNGEDGLKVGEMMNFTNSNMIAKAIESLHLTDGDDVLEIGPGNGMHVKEIIYSGEEINYRGIDISPDMVKEAQKRNKGLSAVAFQLADGETIPYGESRFDKVLTTNTIYFWKDPQAYASEIARVLKPGGMVSIGFIPKSTMQHIPFAKYGFTLYDVETVKGLMATAGLEAISAVTEKEFVTGGSGQQIEREFVIFTAKK